VGILVEVFWAILMVGLPIGIFTMALVWWALRGGHFEESLDIRGLQKELKAMSKKDKKNGKSSEIKQHPLQRKWAKFGGGFYGIVAFFTYIIIEMLEITTMISNFGGFMGFLGELNLQLIIRMLIEALTNFISAMVWPVYWMKRIETDQVWLWFVIAYAGYWLGLRAAQVLNQRRQGAEN
jgi:hypothetical protein